VTIAIAGAGFSGAVIARELAEAGLDVAVFEPRPHVAGNAHTARSDSGVMLHTYGPHIFHTPHRQVWDFVQRFGNIRPYYHRVMGRVGKEVFTLPINLHTINQFFGLALSPAEAKKFVASQCVGSPDTARSLEEYGLATVGQDLYMAFIAGYTEKQWGISPRHLPASVLKRLPLRFDYNTEYFDHPYQGIPLEGYTSIVERMLDHPAISLQLGEAFSAADRERYEHCFWSGPLDRFFEERYGRLSYRTLDFEIEVGVGDVQGCSVLNYCDADIPFTRTTEFKHFTPWEVHEGSVLYTEFSRNCEPVDTPYYPLRLVDDTVLLREYVAAARLVEGVTFVGRLGTYRYLDMDVTILEAMDAARAFLRLRGSGHRCPAFIGDAL